jgi:hypothetical protein
MGVTCKIRGSSVNMNGATEKVAVTVVSAFTMTVQGPVPLQPPPLKPAKVEPGSDAAVKVTEVPLSKDAEQVLPQVIPLGLLVTVPLPTPALVTVRVRGILLKVAVTDVLAFTVSIQTPVPVQPPPLQPVKSESAAGVAIRVTIVP